MPCLPVYSEIQHFDNGRTIFKLPRNIFALSLWRTKPTLWKYQTIIWWELYESSHPLAYNSSKFCKFISTCQHINLNKNKLAEENLMNSTHLISVLGTIGMCLNKSICPRVSTVISTVRCSIHHTAWRSITSNPLFSTTVLHPYVDGLFDFEEEKSVIQRVFQCVLLLDSFQPESKLLILLSRW